MMKKQLFLLISIALVCSSCLTRIVTVETRPVEEPVYRPVLLSNTGGVNTYTTTVTTPKTQTVTTAYVSPMTEDISLYLDLQAVAAAFAQSSTIQEFEMLLNNASYMLSNLDLNRDGYVDYLRVLEVNEGNTHIFLIQAVLAMNVYQDVATVVAEMVSYNTAYIQVIGATYIYGSNYILQPVFVATPPIYAHLRSASYKPWKSPWSWNHYPSYYHKPAPIYLTHYQAYVNTYMTHHHYCNKVNYTTVCHYPDYSRVSRPSQRNDYEQQHPEQSFTVRNANTPNAASTRTAATTTAAPAKTNEPTTRTATPATNARDISIRQAASTTTVTTSRNASSTRQTSTTNTATRSAVTTAPNQTPTRAQSANTSVRSTSSAERSTSVGGTVSSRVSNSGTVTTTRSGSTATRTAATTTTTRSASTSTSTRSAESGTSTRR